MEKYFVYVLLSLKDFNTYTGITNHLERRLKEHNLGQNKSTKGRIPFIILYKEEVANRLAARNREKWLKSGEGRDLVKTLSRGRAVR